MGPAEVLLWLSWYGLFFGIGLALILARWFATAFAVWGFALLFDDSVRQVLIAAWSVRIGPAVAARRVPRPDPPG
jgi:hypothetical protein